MQFGMVGLGRMGASVAVRLMRAATIAWPTIAIRTALQMRLAFGGHVETPELQAK